MVRTASTRGEDTGAWSQSRRLAGRRARGRPSWRAGRVAAARVRARLTPRTPLPTPGTPGGTHGAPSHACPWEWMHTCGAQALVPVGHLRRVGSVPCVASWLVLTAGGKEATWPWRGQAAVAAPGSAGKCPPARVGQVHRAEQGPPGSHTGLEEGSGRAGWADTGSWLEQREQHRQEAAPDAAQGPSPCECAEVLADPRVCIAGEAGETQLLPRRVPNAQPPTQAVGLRPGRPVRPTAWSGGSDLLSKTRLWEGDEEGPGQHASIPKSHSASPGTSPRTWRSPDRRR